MNQDFKDLLRLFAEQGVEYLIVGGYAVMHHAQPRYTKDLDLWIRPERENSQKVAKALGMFGVPLIDVTAEDFAQEGLQFMIGVPPCAVDFLTTVEGLTFEDAWASRVKSSIDEIPVFYLSIPDLLATKRTVARPQDIADIDEIERTMKRNRS